ncbi:ABC transporter ATP-binding protein [Nocardia sp. NPDC058379]|uniref:ABC transporter ATP-binding protein n=1 Tax=unclassified Nocardia TaxID=2637762 RepID=UPI003655148C
MSEQRTRGKDVILQAIDLSKSYGRGRNRTTALQPITRDFTGAERLGIIGESGSGKSTLSRLLAGLDTPTSGTLYWNGRDVATLMRGERRQFRREVQYIAQDTSSSFDPRRTLLDSILQPLRRLSGLADRAAIHRAREVMALLALDADLADGLPGDVSGGQRQRFAIARALVVRPSILLCDEVVSALDVSVQGSILNLLTQYCRDEEAGLIFVSHGIPATAFVAEHLLVMHGGAVVESGATGEVVRMPEHHYTAQLMETVR